jgi:hypothetical protein
MEFFQNIGEQVEERWRASSYSEECFPEIAGQILEESRPHQSLDRYAALKWLVQSRSLPRQRNLNDPFGRPAVQVYDGGRFYLELFHWFDSTTQIHQHGFSGAFHVMAGSSIHSQYEFRPRRSFGPNLCVGDARLAAVEVLEQGATRKIVGGCGMIHSLFHLDRPSVTVVLRTLGTEAPSPHYAYWPPSIAINPRVGPDLLERRVQAIEALFGADQPEADSLFLEACRSSDAFGLARLALAAARAGCGRKRLRRLLAELRECHEGPVDDILEAVLEKSRQQVLVNLRGRIHAPDLRFFLALPLLLDNARDIAKVVARSYPGQDPSRLVLKWIGEIEQMLGPDEPGRDIFGLFADSSLAGMVRDAFAAGSGSAPGGEGNRGAGPLDGIGGGAVLRGLRSSLLGPLLRPA